MSGTIKPEDNLLIDYNANYNPYSLNLAKNCFFQKYDGTHDDYVVN
jgi:hypothetical protein